ncbi:triose-phosphate isomerase [Ferrimicrobium sp.]|uniref:triose-phosphate isomerase n=1 Tax=Ferrimicrobium sp. TaxID=2926050 RepID=UPI00260EA07C|nr:triose-phosphate isomerase [Ferrimicrobium sp.]
MNRKYDDLLPSPDPVSHRLRLISANWKMNLNHLEAIALVQKLYHLLRPEDFRYAEISIHPPFTSLRSLQLSFEADRMPFTLGAQNVSDQASGAFTGEVSAQMLAKLGVGYVIVGHSERRRLFGETSEEVARKAIAVQGTGMHPIVCIGESNDERRAGQTLEVLTHQLDPILSTYPAKDLDGVVIAYEPIWAIGTGESAEPEVVEETGMAIRHLLTERVGAETASRIRLQYGGSVNPGNAHEFMSLGDIDGLLVGGASLDADTFAMLVKSC